MRVFVYVGFTSFIIFYRGVGRGFYALYVKLTELILKIGCPSSYLTILAESVQIQKPSRQIPKAFNPDGNAEKIVI